MNRSPWSRRLRAGSVALAALACAGPRTEADPEGPPPAAAPQAVPVAAEQPQAVVQPAPAPAPDAAAQSAPAWNDARAVASNAGTYLVRYRVHPDPLPRSASFALDAWVFAAASNDASGASDASATSGAPLSDVRLAVDAGMPEHGHGMNRVPRVTAHEDGRFQVEGLLFHMPGKWELYFDISRGALSERAQVALELGMKPASWTALVVALTSAAIAAPLTRAGAPAAMHSETPEAPAPHAFDEALLRRIRTHSPLPAPPHDPTNAVADDPAAARLGQFLFFDPRLSANGALSCATCHDPARGLSDQRTLAQGLGVGTRNTPSLWNVAWQRWLFWDGRADSLWSQALHPLENGAELGGNRTRILHRIAEDAELRAAYEGLFGALPAVAELARLPRAARPVPDAPAHPHQVAWAQLPAADQELVNRVFANVGKVLAAYQRRLASDNAPFDRYVAALAAGDVAAQAQYPAAARRGLELFMGKADCRRCHAGPNFTDNEFHNLGLRPYRDAPQSAVEPGRHGGIGLVRADPFNAASAFSDERNGTRALELGLLQRSSEHFGQFKTPTLRNVALSAPYMHRGQLATLRDVVVFYSELDNAMPAGHHGETILQSLNLSSAEIDDLVAFLESLTSVSTPSEFLLAPARPHPADEPDGKAAVPAETP